MDELIEHTTVYLNSGEVEVHSWRLADPLLSWDGRSPLSVGLGEVVVAALGAGGSRAGAIRRIELEVDGDEHCFFRVEVQVDEDADEVDVIVDLLGRAAQHAVRRFSDSAAAEAYRSELSSEYE